MDLALQPPKMTYMDKRRKRRNRDEIGTDFGRILNLLKRPNSFGVFNIVVDIHGELAWMYQHEAY